MWRWSSFRVVASSKSALAATVAKHPAIMGTTMTAPRPLRWMTLVPATEATETTTETMNNSSVGEQEEEGKRERRRVHVQRIEIENAPPARQRTAAAKKKNKGRPLPRADMMAFPLCYKVLQAYAVSVFDETVDAMIHCQLGKGDSLRGVIALPHGHGRPVKIAVLAEGEMAAQAKEAGADIAGGKDLIQQLAENVAAMKLDHLIAHPDFLADLRPLGAKLGPRNLMPNEKLGTLTPNVVDVVKQMKRSVMFRADSNGIVRVGIGKVSNTPQAVEENLKAVLQEIRQTYLNQKGKLPKDFIQRVYLGTSFGPTFELDIDHY